MPNSTFLPSEIPARLRVMPHLHSPALKVNPGSYYHRADAPASSLHTSVEDLCHWASTSLNRGVYAGQRLLSAAGYEQMWTAAAKRGSAPSLYEEAGLGWTLGHYKEAKTVSHGGAGFGSTAFLLLLPELNCAGVVLCNEEVNAHMPVVRALADTLLGQTPQAGRVSWLVPISQALAAGGVEAAYARIPEIRARADEFYIGEYDLFDLAQDLVTAQELDLAIEVLGINIHVFPEHADTYAEQAKLQWLKGQRSG